MERSNRIPGSLVPLLLLAAQLVICSYAQDVETPGQDPMAPQTEEKFFSQYVFDRNTLILRRRIMLYKDNLYTEWSDWGNCSVKDCTEFRFRKCKDESYEDRITDLFRTKRPSELLKNLSATCGIRPTDGGVETKILGGDTAVPHSWPWQVITSEPSEGSSSPRIVLPKLSKQQC
ncbi:unnamed protein product [Dibothriocephalus latus]|uniref:Uncharacterized protein n=1 Tax=Dibothriocephalus latus TaxID=60516 RepID=A0A3P7MBF3_DIBLA|nr:unnamed protein product [Dibothriocephalus latus]